MIADFSINATSNNLDLASANQQVVASLREQGFNISDDAFSKTGRGIFVSISSSNIKINVLFLHFCFVNIFDIFFTSDYLTFGKKYSNLDYFAFM